MNCILDLSNYVKICQYFLGCMVLLYQYHEEKWVQGKRIMSYINLCPSRLKNHDCAVAAMLVVPAVPRPMRSDGAHLVPAEPLIGLRVKDVSSHTDGSLLSVSGPRCTFTVSRNEPLIGICIN